jgi:hypothetical protein
MSTYNVSNEQQLNQAIDDIDKGRDSQQPVAIDLTANITLNADLSMISGDGNITINGEGHTINGSGYFRGLMIYNGEAQINNLTITNAKASGGAGGNGYGGGGGGAGLGGALFVGAQANVTVNNSYFSNNSAVGGKGGAGGSDATANFGNSTVGGGGGGGMGGAGGVGGYDASGGGGGGIGVEAYGQAAVRDIGYVVQVGLIHGAGIVFLLAPYGKVTYGLGPGPGKGIAYDSPGGAAGQGYELKQYLYLAGHTFYGSTAIEQGGSGSLDGGGGGGGYNGAGGGGGIGGYGRVLRQFKQSSAAGTSNGGFGGGGGGSSGLRERAGNGGFGGGGGGEYSGNGGFGGGGGGGSTSGLGGWGAGNGGGETTRIVNQSTYLSRKTYFGGGGGGLGAGGGVFVETGGQLSFDSGVISGNSVAGGAGGGLGATAGGAYGSGIFGQSGTIFFQPGPGQTVTVADNISDEQTTAGANHLNLEIGGSSGGIVTLQGSDDYTGYTTVEAGNELVLAETGASRIGDIQLTGTIVRDGSNGVTIGGMAGRMGSILIESGTFAIGPTTNPNYEFGAPDVVGTLSGTGGVLQIGAGLGLQVLNTSTETLASTLTGTGTLGAGGSGTLILTGAADGTSLFVDGPVELAPTSSPQSFGTVVDYGYLTLDGRTSITIGALSGPGTLMQVGTATANISGGAFAGQTTITNGTLNLAGDVSNWTGPIVDNSILEFTETGDSTFGGLVTGSGGIVIAGGGTLTLSAGETISNPITIASGDLAIAGGGQPTVLLGPVSGSGTLEVESGVLQPGSSFSVGASGTLLMQSGTLDVVSGETLSVGNLVGSGGVIDLDGGTLIADAVAPQFDTTVTGTGVLGFGNGVTLDLAGTAGNLVFGSSDNFIEPNETDKIVLGIGNYRTILNEGLVTGDITAGANFTAAIAGTIDGNISIANGTISDLPFEAPVPGDITDSYYFRPALISGGVTAAGSLLLSNTATIDNGVTLANGTIVNGGAKERIAFATYAGIQYVPAVISGGVHATSALTLTNGVSPSVVDGGYSEIFGGITAGANSTITNSNLEIYDSFNPADTIFGNIVLTGSGEFVRNGGLIANGVTIDGGGTIINQGQGGTYATIYNAAVIGSGLLRNGGYIHTASVSNGAMLVNENIYRGAGEPDIDNVILGSGGSFQNSGLIGTLTDAGYYTLHTGQGGVSYINQSVQVAAQGTLVNPAYFNKLIDVGSGGLLVNQSAGTLINPSAVISDAGTIENFGLMLQPQVLSTGLLINESTGTLRLGVEDHGTVVNYGTLVSSGGSLGGAQVYSGATLNNMSSGVISVHQVLDAGVVNNAGTINSYVAMSSGATLNNEAGGIISSGVLLQGSDTVINAGTIDGQISVTGSNNRIILAPTSVITGGVHGVATLELEAGTGAIAGGIDASNIILDAGAHWSGNIPPANYAQTISGLGLLSASSIQVTSTLQNASTIAAAITLGGPGSLLDNLSSGVVLGSVTGPSGTVDNSGSISGQVYAGSLINEASGTIGSVRLAAGATFIDHGTVGNVTLSSEGSFVNQGTITGTVNGVGGTLSNNGVVLGGLTGSFNSIDNFGHLAGTLTLNDTLTNEAGGTITGVITNSYHADIVNHGLISASIANAGAQNMGDTLMNYGSISGSVVEGSYTSYSTRVVNEGTLGSSLAVSLGHLTNTSTGVIDGGVNLVQSTEYNYGVINGGDTLNTGMIVNEAGGNIDGGLIEQGTSATVENLGTISGGITLNGQSDLLLLAPSGVVQGPIVGASNFSDTLELLSASSAGTLSGVSNFGTIVFDAGANWVLGGSNTLVNDPTHGAGTKIVGAGALTVTGTLVNNESLGVTIDLASTGTLINNHSGYIGGTLADTGAVINAGTINALSPLGNGVDLINLSGGTIEHAVTATGTGDIVSNAGTIIGGLTLAGNNETLALYAGASPGAVSVLGSNAALELHAGQGTLTNIGINLPDFDSIIVDAGGDWVFDGNYSFNRPVTLGGSGTLSIQETITTSNTIFQGYTRTYHNTIFGTFSNTSTVNDTAILAGGTIINAAGGVFDGLAGKNTTILNSGSIGGAVTINGGLLVNEAGGTFSGAIGGGTLDDTGLLDNATVSHATLILRDGYSVTGTVQGGAGSVLDYEGTGTLSGIGGTFVGFQTIETHGSASLAGNTTIAPQSTLIVYGTLRAPSALTIDGSFVNHGALIGDATIAAGASGQNADTNGNLVQGTILPPGSITGTLYDNGTFTNYGALNGVVLSGNGSTLIDKNAISGSVVATGADETVFIANPIGAGVTLQGLADTLSITGGFFGSATATPGDGDVLLLNGTGTLRGLGSPFTYAPGVTLYVGGFDAIAFAAGADWSLSGPITLTSSLPLVGGTVAALNVSGNFTNGALQGFGVIETLGTLSNLAGGDFTAPVVSFSDVYNAAGGTLASLTLSGGHATNFGTITNGVTLTGNGVAIGLGGQVAGGVLAQGGGEFANVLGVVSGGLIASGSGGYFTIESTGTLDGGLTASGATEHIVDFGTIANGVTLNGTGDVLAIGGGAHDFNYGYHGTIVGDVVVAGASETVTLGSDLGSVTGNITVSGSGDLVSVDGAFDALVYASVGGAVSLTSAGETLDDGGTIAGGISITGAGDRVVLARTAAATKIVTDADGSSIVELQAGYGTLSLGSAGINGPGTIELDAGADWTLTGTLAHGVALAVEGSGTLDASGLVISGTFSDTGKLAGPVTVANGGTLSSAGTLYGPVTVANGGTFLDLPDTVVMGTVSGTSSSTLDLTGNGGTLSGLGTTFTGFGTVAVSSGSGWTLAAGTTIENGTVLDIAGSLASSGSLTDLGSIDNTGYAAGPITIGATGTLENHVAGLIGGTVGVVLSGGLLDNQGLIDATSTGVTLLSGTLDNTGSIVGGTYGLVIAEGGSLDLTGVIKSSGTAVAVSGNQNITLELSGSLSGGVAVQMGSGVDTLQLAPSASYTGALNGTPESTLEFLSGTGRTIGGIQDSFGTIDVDSGAALRLDQIATISNGVLFKNAGSISVLGPQQTVNYYVPPGMPPMSGTQNAAAALVVSGSLVNSGTIDANSQFSSVEVHGGTLDNLAGGVISGFGAGAGGYGSIKNAGTIIAEDHGTVKIGGTIYTGESPGVGVYGYHNQSLTLDNFGTIVGGGNTAVYMHGSNDIVTVEQGAAFLNATGGVGIVIGGLAKGFGGGDNTLNLAAGSGSIDGSDFENFDRLTIATGGDWTLTGRTDLRDGFASLGSVEVDGTLTNTGALYTGTLNDAGTLVNEGILYFTAVTLTGALTNTSGGTIEGALSLSSGTNFVNEAGSTIDGNVTLADGSSFTLDSGSVLNGTITAGNGVTLAVDGTISGPYYVYPDVDFTGTGDTLIVGPDASFNDDGASPGFGTVSGGAGNILELGAGTDVGTFQGLGDFQGFTAATIAQGAAWTNSLGYKTIASGSRLVNDGTFTLNGANYSHLYVNGFLNNSGMIADNSYGIILDTGSELLNSGTISTSQVHLINDDGGLLVNDGLIENTGGDFGILVSGGQGTVLNYGTIDAAAAFYGNYGTTLDNHGTVIGNVSGNMIVEQGSTLDGTAHGTIDFASGATFGPGNETQYIGQVTLASRSDLAIGETNTINATLSLAPAIVDGISVPQALGITLDAGQSLTVQSHGSIDYVLAHSATIFNDYGQIGSIDLSGGHNQITLKSSVSGGIQGAGATDSLYATRGVTQTDLYGFGTIELGTNAFQQVYNFTIASGTTLTDLGGLSVQGTLDVEGTLVVGGTSNNGFAELNGGTVAGGVTLGYRADLFNTTIDGVLTGSGANANISSSTSINGRNGVAIDLTGSNVALQIAPSGQTISGSVTVGGGTIDLTSQTGTASFTGLGSQFQGFDTLTVYPGNFYGSPKGQWDLTGSNTLGSGGSIAGSGTLDNVGTLTMSGGTIGQAGGGMFGIQTGPTFLNNGTLIATGDALLKANVGISGRGTIEVESGSTLEVGGYAGLQTIVLDPGSYLRIDQANSFFSVISGFGAGDTVKFENGRFFANDIGLASSGTVHIGSVVTGGTIIDAGELENNLTISNGVFVLDTGFTPAFYWSVTGEGSSVLEFAGSGSLSGLDTRVSGFGTIETDGNWSLTGGTTLSETTTLTGAGTLTVADTLTVSSTLDAEGTLTVAGTLIDAGFIDNSGSIGGNGVVLNGGSLINERAGTISGTRYGVVLSGASETLVDAGTIAGGTAAVSLGDGDRLILLPGAVLSGGITGTSGSVVELATGTSAGTLTSLGSGVGLTTVDAGATWVLTGTNTLAAGDLIGGAGTLVQAGTLSAAGTIEPGLLVNDGTINVAGSLVLSGSVTDDPGIQGIINLGSGTLEVSGGISRGETIVLGTDATLIVDDAAGFNATIEGFRAGSVIDFTNIGGGASAGLIPQAGGAVTVSGTSGGEATVHFLNNFSAQAYTLSDDAGDGTKLAADQVLAGGTLTAASQTIASGEILIGFGEIAGSVDNAGIVEAQGGTLEIVGSVSGAGMLAVGRGGTLQLDQTTSESVNFDPLAYTESLTLGSGGLSGTIYDFVSGDAIDLTGVAFDPNYQASFTNGVLQMEEGGSTTTLRFDPTQNLSLANFSFQAAPGGGIGTLITEDSTPCYCPGTLIATDRGDVLVERLAIGDRVLTHSGEMRPVKWIGKRSYSGRFVRGKREVLPICIHAGALDENIPARDLWVSPHHAMYLDGVLIEAKDLVNGISIVQAIYVDKVEYYHIELDSHDVILAEGAWAESFIDDDSRGMFHNAHEYAALYPGEEPILARYYAPRVEDGYEVERVRARIAARAGISGAKRNSLGGLRGRLDRSDHRLIQGWAQNTRHPDVPVCLDVLVDGVMVAQTLANIYRPDLAKAGIGTGHHSFKVVLPAALSPDIPHIIEVRRSADGAPLLQSPRLLEASLNAKSSAAF